MAARKTAPVKKPAKKGSIYNPAQQAALDKMVEKHGGLKYARKEYVNKVLGRDGKLGSLKGLRSLMKKAGRELELDFHVAQERFLFIPLEKPMPKDTSRGLVYFQVAVPNNPDFPGGGE